MNPRSIFDNIRHTFTFWVIAGGLLFALVLLAAFIGLLWSLQPTRQPKSVSTAIINVIPLPTDTPPVPLASPIPTSTSQAAPTLLPGIISKGAYVQITGTGTDGLRMRDNPGLDGKVKFVGIEAEVFQVLDGPLEKDGYTWWFLVAPYDENVRGWAVANYLAVIQNP